MTLRTKVLMISAALLAGLSTAVSGTDRLAGLEDCVLEVPGGLRSAQARCGTLEVPENPEEPEGRMIELAFAVSPARQRPPESDPVFFLAGGPGQSARELLPIMQRVLRDLNFSRDLVFLDQRGTGGSNPLDCSFDDIHAFVEPDWDEFEQSLRNCKAQWDADVRFYTTADGADDLELLRQHLGYDQLNLIGGSYGTRMAQVYLRRYPDQVRSMILDGVVPTRLALGAEHAEKLDAALERLFAACAEDDACGERFPGLSESFARLKQTYSDESITIRVTDPRTGIARDMEFTDATLAGSLRFLAYQPESQMKIPYLIDEAATTGDPTRLAAQLLMIVDQMEDMIAFGLNMTVGCSEDWPHWPRNLDQSGTLLGNAMMELYERTCAWWPAGSRATDFHEPFDTEVPILLLSGELDPVTPPSYGDEAAEQYTNSLHLVARGRGHIVLTNRCVSTIGIDFIETGSVDDLDTGCMEKLGPEPFFLDLLGPQP